MKNQFFADERDFLKYDLWMELAAHLGKRRLTFVAMLTADDGTKQGGKTKYDAGKRRKCLYYFLQWCLCEKKRSVNLLKQFFGAHAGLAYDYYPYRDGDGNALDHFDPEKRQEYFAGIPSDLLSNSVVLIDPDTGLQTKTRHWRKWPERYATYEDIAGVAKGTRGDSVLVIVQFPQRNADRAASDLDDRANLLCQELRSLEIRDWSVHWIAQKKGTKVGDLAFFVLAPRGPTEKVKKLLPGYARRHDMLLGISR